METDEKEERPNPAWKIVLVGIPVFLILSSVFAMYVWVKRGQSPELDPRLALPSEQVSVEELDDHLHKLGDLIGVREWDTEGGRKNMRQALAFIEGTLSPQNYGFEVKTGKHLSLEGELWPTVWADLPGTESPLAVVLVGAAYDAGNEEVAVVLSAANQLRGATMAKTVRFVFAPGNLSASGEGKEITEVLAEGESLLAVLGPDLPGGIGAGPDPPSSGATLEAAARELVEKVRKSAR